MSALCECLGVGCPYCRFERQAAAGGEQGPSAVDIELEQLRAELARVKGLLKDPTAVRVNILQGVIALPPGLVWLHDTSGPVAQLREERDGWQRRCLKAESLLEETRDDRDEAQQAAAYAQRDRDAALAQLALLSKDGVA